MNESFINELQKYFILPEDLSEIEYIEMCFGDNIEDTFLLYYKRQIEKLKWYQYEEEVRKKSKSDEPKKNKPYGVIIYEFENKIKGWIEAMSKAEYYIVYSERITVHYKDGQNDMDMKTIDYRPLIDAIKECINVPHLNNSSFKTGDFNTQIRDIGNNILSEFSDGKIGKYNKSQSKVNELFVKSLYPYFLYLKNREESRLIEKRERPDDYDELSVEYKELVKYISPYFKHLKEEEEPAQECITNRELYLLIMKNLKLPSNYEKQIKNAFSDKINPPPLKIDISIYIAI